MSERVERNPSLDSVEAEENLLIDFQFMIQGLMNEKGLSQAELAKRSGLSKARLSQLLSSEANPTVKSIARVMHAMGERATVNRMQAAKVVAPATQIKIPSGLGWERLIRDRKQTVSFDEKEYEVLLRVRDAAASSAAASNDNYVKALTYRKIAIA